MAKKQRTPEQIQADKERMERVRASRQEKHPEPQPDQVLDQNDVGELKKQIEELREMVTRQAQLPPMNQAYLQQTAQVSGGRLTGTTEKYVVDPKYYPDPRERLADEQKLQRFAFKDNYELDYEISVTSYETKDGLNMREPRFKLELHQVVYDEDTDEPTDGRWIVSKAFFHEDPQAAIVVARENGLEVDENNEKLFLDEMRYLRMRDWLFEQFYAPKITKTQQNTREEVVGNRVVEFFTVSSQDTQEIPFEKLKGKV